jgi:hypothetical protein
MENNSFQQNGAQGIKQNAQGNSKIMDISQEDKSLNKNTAKHSNN